MHPVCWQICLAPLVGKSERHIQNSGDFVDKVKNLEMPPGQKLIAYDVSALFTSIPLPDAIKAVRIELDEDSKLQDCTPLSRERILGLLRFCLNTTYFTYTGCDIQTETRSSHEIPSVAHNSKPICGRIRGDCSSHSPHPHASVWFRYVDDTFTVIHEYHVDEFTTHLNSLD